MKLYKAIGRSKLLLIWISVLGALSVLLIFPKECRNGAVNGVFLCLQVLIPSLFPFMLLSDFFVSSGLYEYIPGFIGKAVGKIFGLPRASAAVILLSFVGGYPVGAKGIRALCDKGLVNSREAERMAIFCVGSGPGFLVTYLGTVMLGNTAVGYILLISQTVSIVLLGTVSRLIIKCPSTTPEKPQKSRLELSAALVTSVESTIRSSAMMCALVVIFSTLCEVIQSLADCIPHSVYLISFIEISTGTKVLSSGSSYPMIAFFCGFGGLCVHFQIFTLLDSIGVSRLRFFLFRLMQGVLCSMLTRIILMIFPQSREVFSTLASAEPVMYGSVTGCVLLIICCAFYLVCIRDLRCRSR